MNKTQYKHILPHYVKMQYLSKKVNNWKCYFDWYRTSEQEHPQATRLLMTTEVKFLLCLSRDIIFYRILIIEKQQ